MNDLQEILDQMVVDVSSQALQLDDDHLQLFLDWLNVHSSKVRSVLSPEQTLLRHGDFEELLRSGLENWFESLPMQGFLWEYRLVLYEIAWWRELPTHRLQMILNSETGK